MPPASEEVKNNDWNNEIMAKKLIFRDEKSLSNGGQNIESS